MNNYFYIAQQAKFINVLYDLLRDNHTTLSKIILILPSQRSAREFKRIAAEISGASDLPNILNYSEIIDKYNVFVKEIIFNENELLDANDFFHSLVTIFPKADDASLKQLQNFLVEFFSFTDNAIMNKANFSNEIKNEIISKFQHYLDTNNFDLLQLRRKTVVDWLCAQQWHDKNIYAVYPLNNTVYARKLLNFLSTLPNCKFIFQGKDSYCYKQFIKDTPVTKIDTNHYNNKQKCIKYLEGKNLYEVSSQISFIVREFFNDKKRGKIALITENNNLAKFCKSLVKQWGIEADDVVSVEISYLSYVNIFFKIFEFVIKSNLQCFVNLLTLLGIDITKLYMNFICKYPFISLPALIKKIKSINDFTEIVQLYEELSKAASALPKQDTLQNFFTYHFDAFEKIYGKEAIYINEIASEIHKIKINTKVSAHKYLSIINHIFKTHKSYELESYSRFLILTPIEARLLSFDAVIIADCHFGKNKNNRSYMLEKYALEDKINLERIENSYAELDVKHLTAQPEVFIVENNSDSTALNPLLERFKLSKDVQIITKYAEWLKHKNMCNYTPSTKPQAIIANAIKRLSPTAIELYMYNPYLFYAKYILKLTDIEINENFNKHFGIILHNILAGIKTPMNTAMDLENFMLTCLDKEALRHHIEQSWLLKIWRNKIKDIARWLFDKLAATALREVKITTVYKSVNLEATVDEIIEKQQDYLIVDYKTGILPSNQQVKFGLKPQLMIEMFILHQNDANKLINLEYRQINPPKLNAKTVNADIDFVKEQIDALIKLLQTGTFNSTFNDGFSSPYKHFLRLEEWANQ